MEQVEQTLKRQTLHVAAHRVPLLKATTHQVFLLNAEEVADHVALVVRLVQTAVVVQTEVVVLALHASQTGRVLKANSYN
jgi:hypothetical protein